MLKQGHSISIPTTTFDQIPNGHIFLAINRVPYLKITNNKAWVIGTPSDCGFSDETRVHPVRHVDFHLFLPDKDN